ncbi:MAG: class I SAM-dependent methyltransferase [Candidatus Lokiarchaeota archaeon]|nr:class I SAM-dependent methyltransferase [Candidatus Lokiarchaeota archaeon]
MSSLLIFILNKAKKRIPEIIKEEGLIPLIKRPFRKVKKFLYVRYALLKVKKLHGNYNLESLIDYVNLSQESLIKPLQNKKELLKLLKILKNDKPKCILEIGTASGGTLFLFTRVIAEDGLIISIDLPGGIFGGGFPKWKIPLYKAFARPKQKIYLIRDDSHTISTLNRIKAILKGKKIDFLFIDGDHTYNGVRQDFEMYSPLVKENGKIAFHDIVPHPMHPNSKVNLYWNEIKRNYDYEEIIDDLNQGLWGIGLLKSRL